MNRGILPTLALVLLTAANWQGVAATVFWTNSNGGSWSIPANWNPNQMPGPADIAVITAGGTYTVTLDVSATIDSLSLGGGSGTQTLAKTSASLTLNNDSLINSRGVLNQTGGPLNSSGVLSIEGLMNWAGADVSARLTVRSGGVLIAGWTSLTYLYGALTNSGLVRVTGGGQFNVAEADRESCRGSI